MLKKLCFYVIIFTCHICYILLRQVRQHSVTMSRCNEYVKTKCKRRKHPSLYVAGSLHTASKQAGIAHVTLSHLARNLTCLITVCVSCNDTKHYANKVI